MSSSLPGVLILGGQENTLSLVRNLARDGIGVCVSATEKCVALKSKYLERAYEITSGSPREHWRDLLITNRSEELLGRIILTCNDEAIEFVAENTDTLSDFYILEKMPADVRQALLRKDESMAIAKSAGVGTPNYKRIEQVSDVQGVIQEWGFPIIVKPVHSHRFQRVFDKKLALCRTGGELRKTCEIAYEHRIEVFVCEDIPGPDTTLRSYYTYLDDSGEPLFHFTKKVIRRYPTNYGAGAYHITEWLPEVAREGLKFLQAAGIRGLGNVEFKLDQRDGQLKFIESNARFTAAQEQIVRCGYDLGRFVYGQLAGSPIELPKTYKQNVRFWYPLRDFRAYRQLFDSGQLTFYQWLRSVSHRHVFPFFDRRDLRPFLAKLRRELPSFRIPRWLRKNYAP